jgi:hypothetical protein
MIFVKILSLIFLLYREINDRITLMNGVKKFVRGSASLFFKILLLLVAVVASLVLTFHSPKKIEKSLSESGVYSTFVDSALKEVQKSDDKDKASSNVPINDPAIKAAANQAFTPELLQHSTESVLNGTYDWLSGKTKTPDFQIDLSGAKQTFAQAAGVAAAQRANSLPVCTVAQLQQITPDQDAFTLPCRPPGFDVAAAQSKITNDIANSKDFIGTPVITPQNLPKNSQGQTIFDHAAKAPKVYKWVNASPWLIAALAAVMGGITLLLYDSKRRGLRNLAIGMGGVGIFLLAMSYLTSWLFRHLNQSDGALGRALKGSFQQTALKAANSINHSMEQVVIWFGVSYLIMAIAALLVLHFTKPKSSKDTKDTKHEKSTPKPEAPKPSSAPKPRILVQ